MKAETERSLDSSVPESENVGRRGMCLRQRLAGPDRAALADQNLPIREFVADPAVVPTLDIDTSTIVILVCGADKPSEMAALRRLRRDSPDPAIVVISPPATGTGVRRVLDAGADALVFDPELERTLATTVRAVSIGQSAIPRKFLASVEKPVLSHRENEVLALVRSGLTNAEIAERLFLAESTVKSHLSSIFTKFGVRSRKEVAAAFAEGDHRTWGGGGPRRERGATGKGDGMSGGAQSAVLAHSSNGSVGAAVPFTRLDNADPELHAELLEVVADVSSRAAFTLGSEVEEFERAFAQWCGVEHTIGVSSGTAAIELALRGLGVGGWR